MSLNSPVRVVVVDDSRLQCRVWRSFLLSRYGDRVSIEYFSDPLAAIDSLSEEIDLLLLDWEMPGIDGAGVLDAARDRGIDPKRVIIVSAHSADRLHEAFDHTDCLAVVEKREPEQQAALLMILDEIVASGQQ